MKNTFSKKSGSVIELEVELSKEEFDVYYQNIFSQALVDVEVKGFRKGAAPRELAERAINKQAVFEKAISDAVRSSLNEITQEKEWTVIDQPTIEVSSSVNGLKFKGKFVIFPEIKLCDYKKIVRKLKGELDQALKKITAEPEDIEKSLNWLLDSRAKTVAISRAAQKGDVVEIEYEIGGKPNQDRFILGKGSLLPGFEDKLIGRKAGESAEFSLKAPDNYWKEDLRGKELNFKVKINNVFERILPELSDDFAKGLGKFKDLADLKENLKLGILQEKQAKVSEKFKIKMVEEIVQSSDIDIPEVMVNRAVDSLVKEYEPAWKGSGKTEEQARQDFAEAARKKAASHLILYKIAEDENLKPTKEEIENEMAKHQHEVKNLDNDRFYGYIYEVLQNKKVFDFLEKQ